MYDIAIIGGGCIGNYLALKLSKLGFKIIVFEKKADSGINICCTGIISKDCYHHLTGEISLNALKMNSASILTPDYKNINFHSDHDIAYIVERSGFEKSLAREAQSNGALIKFSTTVTDISIQENKAVIYTTNTQSIEQFESEMVIIATGYGPKLPCMSYLENTNNYIIGAQTEVNNPNNNILEIYLDKHLAPAGFAWLVPTWDNRGLAGLLCKSNPKVYMEKFINLLISQGKINNQNYQISHAPIPVEPLKRTYMERLLVVGEAAGQVKPLTGGGIYYGLLCADIAVATIKDAFRQGDLSANQLSVYQKRWHHLLKTELRISRRLRHIWEKLNNNNINRLIEVADKLNLISSLNDSDKIHFDWHARTLSNLFFSIIPFAKYK
jgi:geranylgeranyl reductase family protein